MPETITIKNKSVSDRLAQSPFIRFFNITTIGNNLRLLVKDGFLARESITYNGEVIYRKVV